MKKRTLEYVLKSKQPQRTLLTTVQKSTSQFLDSTRQEKKSNIKNVTKKIKKKNSPSIYLSPKVHSVHMIRQAISISTIKKESKVKNVTKKDLKNPPFHLPFTQSPVRIIHVAEMFF